MPPDAYRYRVVNRSMTPCAIGAMRMGVLPRSGGGGRTAGLTHVRNRGWVQGSRCSVLQAG